jgi:leader peptidase (prepilin peptidase) / N-methyltransferase
VITVILGIIGALIGSFGNVVIYRLPLKKSVVWPRSSCPKCGHMIRPWENIPIISWLFLRGKCSNCKNPISIRYPLIEALTAAGFVALALRFPLETYGFTVFPLLAIYAMMVMMSMIDVDHYILPDSLTLPALIVGILGTLIYAPESGLPTLMPALAGGAIGAGIIALINRVGSLVLRRFADTKERLWPIGMDQVNVAAVGGALGGWWVGLGVAAASFVANLVTRKPLRLPEQFLYALWVIALVFSTTQLFIHPLQSIAGSLAATGIISIVGATFWWLRDIFSKQQDTPPEDDDEPVAMGFGDVKLAAVLGVFLGWQNLLVALLLAFVIGAIGGVIGRIAGGSRMVPFGPYLAIGGMLALFVGQPLIAWYLGMLGL